MFNVVPKEGPRAPLFCSALALLLSVNAANAQSVDVSTLKVCAGLETEALKLACFEAIIAKGTTAESGAASADESVPVAPNVGMESLNAGDSPANVNATSQSAGTTSASSVMTQPSANDAAVVNAPTSNTQPSPETDVASATIQERVTDNVGREQLDQEEQNEIINATVVDVTKGYNRELQFHLANGQVWRQIEPRFFQYPKNTEFEIEIAQGMLGAYRMRIGEKGRQIKIRRIQ